MLGQLPANIQAAETETFNPFKKDPFDSRLHNEELHDTKSGRHRNGSRSVVITRRYGAVYVVDRGRAGRGEEQACWYWIGSHESYNTFTGSRG